MLLLPFAVHAGPKLVKDRTKIKEQPVTHEAVETRQAADSRQVRELPPVAAHGKFYNQCSGQQFVMKDLGTMDVLNGGLGDGDRSAFFCGESDELSFAHALRPEDFRARGDPNRPEYDRAGYSFYSIQDNCREAGFGNVKPDNRRVVVGVPESILHCDARGSNGNYSFEEMRRLDGSAHGGDRESERTYGNPDEEISAVTRNRHTSDNFSFGRYLIRMVPADRLPEKISHNSNLSLMGLKYETLSDQYWYKQESLPPYFLDIPYDETREWMTCGLYADVRHPDADPGRSKKGEPEKKENDSASRLYPDRLEHYRDLNGVVWAMLGNAIREDKFFPYPPVEEPASVGERMSSDLVGSIYAILTQFAAPEEDPPDPHEMLTPGVPHRDCVPGADCLRDSEERRRRQITEPYRNDPVVPIFSCPAQGIVEYQPDKHRICIDPPVANDCLSQKTKGSDRHHNVDNCDPSNGRFDARGLVDDEITLSRGYELYADTVVEGGGPFGQNQVVHQVLKSRRQPATDALLSAVGYSPVIVSKIIHHRIHAFSCEKLGQCLHKLHGPARDLQERLATVGESLAYTYLCRAGYCDYDYGPQSRDVITAVGEDPSGDITGVTVAREFFFQDSCRGFGGIPLGPYCTDMFNMTRVVESGDAELVGVMAQFYSNLGEIEKPLPLKQLSGVVRGELIP